MAECNVQQKMDDEQKINAAGDCSYGWMHVVKAILDFLGIFAASFGAFSLSFAIARRSMKQRSSGHSKSRPSSSHV